MPKMTTDEYLERMKRMMDSAGEKMKPGTEVKDLAEEERVRTLDQKAKLEGAAEGFIGFDKLLKSDEQKEGSAPSVKKMTPEQMQMYLEKKQKLDEQKRLTEEQRKEQEILKKLQDNVEYTEVLARPGPGYMPIPKGIEVDRKKGIPVGIPAGVLSDDELEYLKKIAAKKEAEKQSANPVLAMK